MSDSSRPTIDITLLERQYTIACPPEEEDKLERAARYLDRAMQGIHSQGKVMDREKVAIMAALNIANELLETHDEQRLGEQNLSELSERLDKALSQTSPKREGHAD
ncbi:cell division protein ZapA [Halomonas sp. 18H]|uniref:cell division protein ZapA n=1 Tax=Halomonas almeriensis TaxID=308163 RepID=UPI0022319018|nr:MULTISPECIES: cell division protein ZapA [Halomonas]MCW4152036.1 cell division protein ZapA [Halomonas sp. 18H]MDN3552472.1 cell division protein ZapA [Halomonas almeriensis]